MKVADAIKDNFSVMQADFARPASAVSKTDKDKLSIKDGKEVVTVEKGKVPVRYIKDEIILKPAPYLSAQEVGQALEKYGLSKVPSPVIEKIGYIKVQIASGSIEDTMKNIRKDHRFMKPEPNYVLNSLAVSDPLYAYQSYVQETNFDKAWDNLKSSNTVKVAVIDTGVDASHPDLQGKVSEGYNFYSENKGRRSKSTAQETVNILSAGKATDDNGHGTFIAGIIAASANDIGIKGLSDKAQIIPVKVVGSSGAGTYEDTASGIIWAADAGAKVINLSIGGYSYSDMLKDAIDYALSKGCVIVAAGGNEGVSEEIYPAAYPDVIGVAALSIDGQIWKSSNSGKHIDVCAPGQGIISTAAKGNYVYDSGTSASAAMVSALAATLISEKPELSNMYVANQIAQSAKDLGEKGRDNIYGFGEIDAAKALSQNVAPFHDIAVRNVTIENMATEKGKPVSVLATVVNTGTYASEICDVQLFEISWKDKKLIENKKDVKIEGVSDLSFQWKAEKVSDGVRFEVVVINKDDSNSSNNIKQTKPLNMQEKDGIVYIKHESDPSKEVHQYFAGEAGKVWPGWNGSIYKVDFIINRIKYTPIIDNAYAACLKFYINDNMGMVCKDNGHQYYPKGEWVDINYTIPSITVHEILSIGAIALVIGDGGQPIKLHIVKKRSSPDAPFEWGNSATGENENGKIEIEYSIGDSSGTVDYIRLPSSMIKASEEITKYLGTKLIMDDENGKLYATYSGNVNDDITQRSSNKSRLMYYPNVPYSNFDAIRYEESGDTRNFVTDGNNDIIEGTHEEDLYNPAYEPENVWKNGVGGRDGILRDEFYFCPSCIDGTSHIFSNHFWNPKQYNDGWLNVGGHVEEPNASSAQLKAQLYWDYYVIPQYMRGEKDSAYYNLGRVTHLLQDMSSLPHVHRDAHPPIMWKDYYEIGIGNEYTSRPEWGYSNNLKCIDFNDITKYIDDSPYVYTPSQGVTFPDKSSKNALEEWFDNVNTGGWPYTIEELDAKWKSMSPLFHLFYSMAETTNNYPSVHGDGDFIKKDNDWEENNWRLAANDIMPKMLSHVAGLYRLFWVSIHFPTQLTNHVYSGYLEDDASTIAIADAMRKSYADAFSKGFYLGSPTGDCLVIPYIDESTQEIIGYYRTYSNGGLFYNISEKKCFYIGKEIWGKWLTYKTDDEVNVLGMPIADENKVPGLSIVNFENGAIHYWDSTGAFVILHTKTCLRPKKFNIPICKSYIFPDVCEDKGERWYNQYIGKIKELGIIKGRGDGLFHPTDYISKAEAIKMLYIATGMPTIEECSSPAPWYCNYVQDAAEKQFIEKGDFKDESLTRVQVVELAFKILQYKIPKLPSVTTTDSNARKFSDTSDAYVFWFANTGIKANCPNYPEDTKGTILSGFDDGTFKPNQCINRAEMAKFIVNLHRYLNCELPQINKTSRSRRDRYSPLEGDFIGNLYEQTTDFILNNSPPDPLHLGDGDDQIISDDQILNITGDLQDVDGDKLFYFWTATGGYFTTNDPIKFSDITWYPPPVTQPQTFTINLIRGDGQGYVGRGTFQITVTPSTTPNPSPTSIAITASLLPTTASPSALVNVSGKAVYNTGKAVISGTVTIKTNNSQVPWNTTTDSAGNFSKDITAPSSSGDVAITVTDGTLSKTTTVPITINIVDNCGAGDQFIIYCTKFDNALDTTKWKPYSTYPNYGRVQVINGSLILDSNGGYSTNNADLHVDLSGQTDADLTFTSKFFGESGSIYFSDNGGQSFTEVYTFSKSYYPTQTTLNIADIAKNYDLSLTSNFVIRFQQRGRYVYNTEGLSLDEVTISKGKYLRVSPESQIINYQQGSTGTINVDTNLTTWQASSDQSWLKVSKNANTVTVRADSENLSSGMRNADVTISSPGSGVPLQTVQVTQANNNPYLTIQPGFQFLSAREGSEVDFQVMTSLDSWKQAGYIPDWLEVRTGLDGTTGLPEVKVIARQENSSASSRTARIEIVGDVPGKSPLSTIITVTQESKNPQSKWITIPNPFDINVLPDPWHQLVWNPAVFTDESGIIHIVGVSVAEMSGNSSYKYDVKILYRQNINGNWGTQEIVAPFSGESRNYNTPIIYPKLTLDKYKNAYLVYEKMNPDATNIAELFYVERKFGQWSLPKNLSETPCVDPAYSKILADNNGKVYVFWKVGQDGIYYRTKSNGEWSAKQKVGSYSRFDVKLDSSGRPNMIGMDYEQKKLYYMIFENNVWSDAVLINESEMSTAQLYIFDNDIYVVGYEGKPVYFMKKIGSTWEKKQYQWDEFDYGGIFLWNDKNGNLHIVYCGKGRLVERIYNGSQWTDYQFASELTPNGEHSASGGGDFFAAVANYSLSGNNVFLSFAKYYREIVSPEMKVTPEQYQIPANSATTGKITAIDVSNTGTGNLIWSAESKSPWIKVTEPVGAVINNGKITFEYDASLAQGDDGFITIQANNGQFVKTVTIKHTVPSVPQYFVDTTGNRQDGNVQIVKITDGQVSGLGSSGTVKVDGVSAQATWASDGVRLNIFSVPGLTWNSLIKPVHVEVFDGNGKLIADTFYPFSDIGQNEWYTRPIMKLWKENVLSDFGDTKSNVFGPNNQATRAEYLKVALVADQVANEPDRTYPAYAGGFTDVTSGDSFAKYVQYALTKKIISGCEATKFCPADLINKSLATKITMLTFDNLSNTLSEYLNGKVPSKEFSDVKDKSQWYYPYIYAAVQESVVNGYSDGTFKPENPISRAEMVKMNCIAAFGEKACMFSDATDAPVVTKVSPTTVELNKLATFTVTGRNLPATTEFSISDCINPQTLAGGTDQERKFTCTPSNTAGVKAAVIKDKPNGKILLNFKVIVMPVSCTYNINLKSNSLTSSGGNGSVSVTATNGCDWTAKSNAGWITVKSGDSGNGNGTVSYSVASNSGTSSRIGTITVAGQTFTVTQSGIRQYTITATAGANGSISPVGMIKVNEGANQTFGITPNTGYSVENVSVDGVSQGALPSYTFINVNANHAISVNFKSTSPVVNFPDPNLNAVVRQAISKPSGDIFVSDLQGLTSLSGINKGIVNLEGLQYCTNLTELTLTMNQISNINPISGLSKLTSLLLGSNQISDISMISGLTNLTALTLDQNKISNISVLSGLTKLNVLWLDSNQISNISTLSALTNLTHLHLSWNHQISDVSPLSGLKNLDILHIGYNQISNISPLSSLTKLRWLILDGNQISNISALSGLTTLNSLSLSENQVSNISALSGLINLGRVDLYDNKISDISPLISNSGISSGDTITLRSNPLSPTSCTVYIPQLQSRGVTVDHDCPADVAVLFPDSNLNAVVRQAINKPSGDIFPSDLQGLTSLYGFNKGIANLEGLQYCTNLTELTLTVNQISNINPISGLSKLTRLSLGANQVSDISMLSGLTNLTTLTLDQNKISNISALSGLTKLNVLWLDSNQISNISTLSALTSLTHLVLGSNHQISDVSPLSGLKNLDILRLGYNQISNLSPLSSLTKLTWLDLEGNQISNISALSGLNALTSLSLYKNQISSISALSGLTKLNVLWLHENQISSISALAGLNSLTKLSLGDNQLSNISALSGLINLGDVTLYNNKISDISPLVNNSGISSGDTVTLWTNPLSTTSCTVHIPQLQSRGVTVQYSCP